MRNVVIAYALSFLWRCWFWLGVWVFYYLRFTDYAGIGFLEAVMITTATIGEIPTGAIADMVGKKKAVILAFGLGAIGNLAMALAPNYSVLLISIITMTLGGAFYSGSLEALVYDSLIEDKKIDLYQKVIGRITTMQNLGMALAGIVGGFLYQINVSLPFFLVALVYLIGIVVSLQLTEPIVDTAKYSWNKFFQQIRTGFDQLFANKMIAYMVLLFLLPGAFMIATENVINDATAIELGFNSAQLGIFVTTLYLLGVLVSEKTEWIVGKLNSKHLYILMLTIYLTTLLVIPKANLVVGALLLLVRYGASTIFNNYESIRINAVIESKYRATTLSTFNLFKNIPYVFAATGIGVLMNIYTAKIFSLYFGVVLIVGLGIIYLLKPIFIGSKQAK